MHIQRIRRILATTAALACLATLPACEGGADAAPPAAPPSAPPEGPLTEAQRYVRQYGSCEELSTAPDDPRLAADEITKAGEWSVTARGVCSDKPEHGEIVLSVPSDMREFQTRYKQYVMDRIAGGDGAYGLNSRILVGKGFVATPTRTKTALALVRSELRVLTCNPTAPVPKGYKREAALVEGCQLSDFVGSTDGSGSPNLETPQDPGAGATEKPGQPKTGSLGLARAGGIAELRKLVGSSLRECEEHFSTDPEAVAVESIDYQPVVKGKALDWGITGRALCGRPAGAQRAVNLSWLDTVGDMGKLQTKAKAAQLAELKEAGKLRATTSLLLVGENIAVETNDPDARFGLYQQQFLYLNCAPGFSAPSGYRLEKAQVEGCVLTNYEPEHPVR
ncbi:hypothetical protein [Streptomyces sp. NPDC051109]|uniref:hypothetical protein n=1 Tax=Streptomyces sp. NPDC051109 TaxID=3365642 RepID=UPI00379BC4CE